MDRIFAVLIVILSLVDSGFTLHIINTGGYELNPVMGAFIDKGYTFFVIMKALLVSAAVYVIYKYRNVKFLNLFEARNFLYCASFLYSALVTYEVVLITGI